MAFLFQLVFPLLPEEGIKGRREKSLANDVYLALYHPRLRSLLINQLGPTRKPTPPYLRR